MNAAPAHPGSQRRARDRNARSAADGFLPVQRQVIKVLRHQHLREQPGCRDALVDDVGRYRRLDQRLASGAHPFAADVALAENGHEERLDYRSKREQGDARPVEPRLFPSHVKALAHDEREKMLGRRKDRSAGF